MPHALMYHGGFERNRPALKSGATTFQGSDGADRPIPPWPPEATGLRVGYMEQAGKNFAAVRVQDDQADIVLDHPLLLEPSRHMGYGKRFSAEPTMIGDDVARVLIEDIIERNPEQRAELIALRHRVLHPEHPERPAQ
jgi:hypothetical protein